MLTRLLLNILLGASAGAILGAVNQCASGTCPLTATWWRGALIGAGLAAASYFSGPRAGKRHRDDEPSTPN